jgi:RNA polymerase sigma factor (sigma-70 family)
MKSSSPFAPRPCAHCLRQTPRVHPDGESTDDALMAAYARGDVDAFEQLYARHQASLYRFVRRLLGRTHAGQVDEAFQDTWLRVVHARARWQPEGATFRTWLFTLAHHRVIDLLRRSGREVAIDALEGDGDDEPWQPEAAAAWAQWPAPAGSATPSEDLAFWRRAGERLLGCLEQLPLPQRSAFLLHHDDGLTLDEVARALEVGFETAKTRLRYAMTKLRACMGAYLAPIAERAR